MALRSDPFACHLFAAVLCRFGKAASFHIVESVRRCATPEASVEVIQQPCAHDPSCFHTLKQHHRPGKLFV